MCILGYPKYFETLSDEASKGTVYYLVEIFNMGYSGMRCYPQDRPGELKSIDLFDGMTPLIGYVDTILDHAQCLPRAFRHCMSA